MASTVVGMEARTSLGGVSTGRGAFSAGARASSSRMESKVADGRTSTDSSLERLCRWIYPIGDSDEFIRTSLLWGALAVAR